jgi:hypothetical protein
MVNKAVKKIVSVFLLFLLFVNICAADAALQEAARRKFAEDIQRYLPFTALTPLVWSDSYIGQIISRKPHFGVGLSYGMSTAGFSSARELVDELDANGYLNTDGVFMPPMYVHARIGGFFVPFDIGFIASIPVSVKPADKVTSEQYTIGGDVRFVLVREGLKVPGISLGVAYVQTKGILSVSGQDASVIRWEGGAIEIKAQVSKTIQNITPYFGVGGSYTWSQASYGEVGISQTMDPEKSANGILFRVFGGTSINFWAFRLDLGVNVGIPDAAYGVVSGLRFQL